jgi:hypothetical protein
MTRRGPPYAGRGHKHAPEQQKASAFAFVVYNELEGIEDGCKRMHVVEVALNKGVPDTAGWQGEGALDAQVLDVLWRQGPG